MVSFWSKPPLGLVFIHWVQYTSQVGIFQPLVLFSFLDCHQMMFTLFPYVLLFPACDKKAFSYQIRLLHKREHVLSGFQAIETSCKQPVHTELLAVDGLIPRRYYTALSGKMARVVFWSKPPLRLVFVPCVEYALHVWSFLPLLLWSVWDCHQ